MKMVAAPVCGYASGCDRSPLNDSLSKEKSEPQLRPAASISSKTTGSAKASDSANHDAPDESSVKLAPLKLS